MTLVRHTGGFSVSARCLDEGTVTGMTYRKIDGRNWERHDPQGRGTY